jgi:SAM-dependent methyltransferase
MDKKRPNPWLSIPASEYESHMKHPDVGQWDFLESVFKEWLAIFRPRALAIAGCATGNGFEYIDFNVTQRVLALDINADFLDKLRYRYTRYAERIETVCGDITSYKPQFAGFNMIHCALIFEYMDVAAALMNMKSWLAPDGVMTVVLQMPDSERKAISETPFKRLLKLSSIMKLLDPSEFKRVTVDCGLRAKRAKISELPSGKKFYTAVYSLVE